MVERARLNHSCHPCTSILPLLSLQVPADQEIVKAELHVNDTD